ncbi:MAG TPA: 50S ribosomal protein L24 [Bacillota bacterium]|nr:50S ribosomal protein L24 [Bacillota bacterium]HOH10998.1 50S ribosomal protein L24 [Bacillota bacterium]HOS50438.1 50S ribosomal protein L24 [Bacillota bacterium]HPI02126.1 50S ribosomal protein L24 [Bacillota bacterium]HPM64166.1 50S ribosomal protein L24 [Bacillota bacterium]
MKIKKGDNVQVITGKDAGRKGKVLRTVPADEKVIVENMNIAKKHMKPSKTAPQGGIVDTPMPIHASKVMVVCSKCNKATRVRMKADGEGKFSRTCAKCGTSLDK